jgi:hypothetical protein
VVGGAVAIGPPAAVIRRVENVPRRQELTRRYGADVVVEIPRVEWGVGMAKRTS